MSLANSIAARFDAIGLQTVAKLFDPTFYRAGGAALWAGNTVGEKFAHPYQQSVWVQRAIKYVADPVASADLIFTSDARGGKARITDPKIAAFWQAPALGMEGPISYTETIRATVSWLKLSGEAFWLLGDEWLTTFAERTPFILARPEKMRPIILDGRLTLWEYTDGGGKKHQLLPEQVVHPKLFNPYDLIRGLGEMAAAEIAAEGDFLAGAFIRNLARNNGDRGEYIISKGNPPSDDQREQIVRTLREKKDLSQRGIFKPMFIPADVTIEDPKTISPDSAMLTGRKASAEEIFVAFGVPPSFCQLAVSHSVGSFTDNFKLIESTCIPMADNIADHVEAVTNRLGGKTRGRVYAQLSFDNHSVLREQRSGKIETWAKMVDKGIPGVNAGEWLGLGLPRYPGDDVGFVAFNVQTIEDAITAVAPVNDPALADQPPEKPAKAREVVATIERLFAGRKPLTLAPVPKGAVAQIEAAFEARDEANDADYLASCTCGDHPAPNAVIGKAPNLDAVWSAHMMRRKPIVKAFKSKVTKALMAARIETLRKVTAADVGEAKAPAGIEFRKSALDLVFDLVRFGTDLWIALRKVEELALDTAGQQALDELPGEHSPWKTPDAEVVAFLAERENYIKSASQLMFDRIRGIIQDGINARQSTTEIADAIKAAFTDLAQYEAQRIALTETAAAYGLARDLAQKKAGVQFKQWLTSRNSNVRPAHQEAEGQQRGINDAYEVGGALMMFPGDGTRGAGPELIINCHCISTAIPKLDLSNSDQP